LVLKRQGLVAIVWIEIGVLKDTSLQELILMDAETVMQRTHRLSDRSIVRSWQEATIVNGAHLTGWMLVFKKVIKQDPDGALMAHSLLR
jgi:hypothetical protein